MMPAQIAVDERPGHRPADEAIAVLEREIALIDRLQAAGHLVTNADELRARLQRILAERAALSH